MITCSSTKLTSLVVAMRLQTAQLPSTMACRSPVHSEVVMAIIFELVEKGGCTFISDWPCEGTIIITLHQVQVHRHMCTFTITSIGIHSNSHLVASGMGIKSWTAVPYFIYCRLIKTRHFNKTLSLSIVLLQFYHCYFEIIFGGFVI